ncbi:MAG: hypothetical protein AB4290_05860 [Spirulina sp.]
MATIPIYQGYMETSQKDEPSNFRGNSWTPCRDRLSHQSRYYSATRYALGNRELSLAIAFYRLNLVASQEEINGYKGH